MDFDGAESARRHRCVWCTLEKPEAEFNREHVLPRAFGTFEQNLTLVHKVCTACNNFFSRELEPWLARDSVEGLDRFRFNDKNTAEFKSQGTRSTTRGQFTEGAYAGAWGFHIRGHEMLGLTPFPQIGFSRSDHEPFEWFMRDDVPTADMLRAAGYERGYRIRICECDLAEATALLAARGIACTDIEPFVPPVGRMWAEQVFRPTVDHRRALAKIAFNYFVHEHGRDAGLSARFDACRDLVMRGIEPTFTYYEVSDKAEFTDEHGEPMFCHVLTVFDMPAGGVSASISLYNRLLHTVCLTTEGDVKLGNRAVFFNIVNRRISRMRKIDETP